ncbi:unnamed protein product [marine sediment metagenome]|uniref:Uncharacterized protein n=1 Tax=marine sediment metagenome TaxID=412755 RepID=X0ZMP0_9ZZZZ
MMFHEDAPASEITKPLPLIRPKAEKPLNTIILAKRWVGLYTHWWGGKTVRCPDTGCRACDRNIARIWKGFIPVCDAFMMSSVALLQFTGRCTVTLNENKRDPGGLLGSRVLWTRIGKAINSPLRCELIGWADVKECYTYERTCDIVAAVFRDNGELQTPE